MALSNIITGKRAAPRREFIYGVSGIGKSYFVAQIPDVIVIDLEGGLNDLEVARFPQANSLEEATAQVQQLIDEEHTFKAVAVDTVDWLERYIWESITGKGTGVTIGKAQGGYGQGYSMAADKMRAFLELLEQLRRQKGMSIYLLAHAKTERFNDPEHEPYDRFTPKLHHQARELILEWCDECLFAYWQTFAVSSDGKPTKAAATGKRMMRTTSKPFAVAKNRLNLSDEMAFDYNEFSQFLNK